MDDLGFDACIGHRDPAFAQGLAEVVPGGVDVCFENVGGAVFDAVWPHLNVQARVPVCGLVAGCDGAVPEPRPDRLPDLATTLITKRIRIQGFLVSDHPERGYEAFMREMSGWMDAGQVKAREDVAEGPD